jgi:hypothetical protein
MRRFAEGVDYRWRVTEAPWWHRLPLVHDYAHQAELMHEWSFSVMLKNGRPKALTVPKGYRWNGASAGQTFRGEDDPRVMRATLAHDFLYDKRHRPAAVTRASADALCLAMLKQDGAPWWFRALVHVGARCGLFAWAWRRGVT